MRRTKIEKTEKANPTAKYAKGDNVKVTRPRTGAEVTGRIVEITDSFITLDSDPSKRYRLVNVEVSKVRGKPGSRKTASTAEAKPKRKYTRRATGGNGAEKTATVRSGRKPKAASGNGVGSSMLADRVAKLQELVDVENKILAAQQYLVQDDIAACKLALKEAAKLL